MLKFVYIFFLILVSFTFFKVKTDLIVTYGDSGFMWQQMIDLVQTGYKTFAYQYPGSEFDPVGNFSSFRAPFLGYVNEKLYIDFPPYFPLFISFFYVLFGSNLGVYLIQLIGLTTAIFYLYRLIYEIVGDQLISLLLGSLFLFATTVFTYNLVIHEYSIGLMFLYSGLYYLIKKDNQKYITSAFLLGFSLFFRLEFIFVISIHFASLFLFYQKKRAPLLIKFSPVFIVMIVTLFALNEYIHGHPLGLRYTLTMNDPVTVGNSRTQIVYELLFGKLRGFFYQSPYLMLVLGILPFLYFRFDFSEKDKRIIQTNIFVFFFGLFFLLLFSPNHGDHISPRYLFGLYPSIFVLSSICFQNLFLQKKDLIRRLILGFLFLSILFSVRQFYKNVQFIQKSDQNVALLNHIFISQPEKNFIFLEQALPKNLQTLMFEKSMYYLENPNQLETFLKMSNLPPKDILIVSTELNVACIENSTYCHDKQNVPGLHFYRSND